MQKVPKILVCNDDGITAPGIKALCAVAREFGEVTVVAPDSAQSGMGHAITIGEPLRLVEEEFEPGHRGWACSGTPADCVKLATGVLMPEKPDLLISGINHGANYSISVVYSGTMSAAMEGAIEGIPSIGFSLCDFSHEADFSASKEVARAVIRKALHAQMPQGTLLNVNIPKLPLSEIKGIRITRQAIGRWIEEFDQRLDPYGRKYYWLTGKFQQEDEGQDTDTWALDNGFVSVCPVQFDLTAHHAMAAFNQWNLQIP
ncbi:MAG TPA: 5'/3'-nucleotidase SurE [Bacteroidia bacterium]|nr:5'/3'-nucleotidase SurE [Bacteroidia bacterium]